MIRSKGHFVSWSLGLAISLCALQKANSDVDQRYEKRAARAQVDFTVPVAANEIKIMSYNVENLFDTVHDEGKSDWEFLPKSSPLKKNCESEGLYKKKCYDTNWTDEHLALKINQIARVVAAQGALPDAMGIVEVENERVVGMLAKKLGYAKFVMTNSPDARGIDVALMYNEGKIHYLNHTEKEVKFGNLKTRNLLAVNFSVHGSNEILGLYVNHWPSQGKKSDSRMAVATQLKELVEAESANKANYKAILMGDFNTIDSDLPHPIHDVITNVSLPRPFYDVQNIFDGLKNREKNEMPQGSYFYFGEGVWNRLDKFFASPSLVDKTGLQIMPESFRIIAPEFMTRAYEFYSESHHMYQSVIFGIPKGYDHNAASENTAGFSDHFPIVLKLKMN
jgi:predicted extracellular nuclease